MQKIRKILRVVSETALPTNQPIIMNNTDFIEPGWRRSKNKSENERYAYKVLIK